MSEALNEIHAYFGVQNSTTTAPIKQWAYGQKLIIHDPNLPNVFEAYYSNSKSRGDAKPQIGQSGEVRAPHEYFKSGTDIYVFLMQHEGEEDGRYNKVVHIPITPAPKPVDIDPDPEESIVIGELVDAMNNAVAQCEAYVEHYPTVINGEWYVWDESTEQFVTTGVAATGNGIASARLNSDYTLTLVFTDGTFFTTPISIRGATGATPSISATASTLPEGSSASVSVTGTTENPAINFGIPKGDSGVPTDAQVQSAVDEWFEDHPEGIVPDGSLTEDKFTSATQKKVINDYATPEMFGAVGDGTTDDTQAIIDMFASDYDVFRFAKKTYLVDGSIDVTKKCESYFNNTTLKAKASRYVRDFEYILGFKAVAIYTYGLLQVDANSSVNIAILLAEAGRSCFEALHVGNARIWGLYVDKTTDNNNAIKFGRISAGSCGQKIKAKGKYLTPTTLQVTGMTGFAYNDFARSLFNNEYNQNRIIIDDSLYTRTSLYNRFVFLNPSGSTPFAQDEQDAFSGVFTLAGVGNNVPNDYADGNNGRDIFIPIGGGLYFGSAHSEGVYSIDTINSQSNCMSMYMSWGYGGRIGTYTTEFDTMVMYNNSLHTSIDYMYIEGTGNAFKNKFNSQYDRIIVLSENTNGTVFVHNPFVGLSRVPFMDGNNVVLSKQLNVEGTKDLTLFSPAFLSSKKLQGWNIASPNASWAINIDEYSPRQITVAAPGYAAAYTVRLNLVNPNTARENRFEPITFFVRRSRKDTSYISFIIDMTTALINAGFTLHGAVNNKVTINPVDYGNHMKVTIILFSDTKTFYVTAEALTFVDNTV